MNILFRTAALFLLVTAAATAQTRTDETVTTTDSSGRQNTTQVTRISTTEDITPRHDMIVLNPLKFFLYYNLSYFHAISPNMALGGGIQMPTKLQGDDVSGFGLNIEARFHPSKKALKGFYIAPNASINWLSDEYYTYQSGYQTTATRTAMTTSIGVLVGWQWFPWDDFAMGLGIGFDHYFVSTNEDVGAFDDFSGTMPALRFDIGYAW